MESLTYQTGHTCDVPRSFVESATMDKLLPLVAAGRGCLPNSNIGVDVVIHEEADNGIATLHFYDASEGPTHVYAMCVQCLSEDCADRAWFRVLDDAVAVSSLPLALFLGRAHPPQPRKVPWITTILTPLMFELPPESMGFLGCMEGCVGWAVIEHLKGNRRNDTSVSGGSKDTTAHPHDMDYLERFTNATHRAMAEAEGAGVASPVILIMDTAHDAAAALTRRHGRIADDRGIAVAWASKASIIESIEVVLPERARHVRAMLADDHPFVMAIGDDILIKRWDSTQRIVVSNDPTPAQANLRTTLMDLNREKIEVALLKAEEGSDKSGAVIVIDLNDPLCRLLADALKPSNVAYNERLVTECNEQGTIPVQILGMSQWNAYKVMRRVQQLLHRSHRSNPRVSDAVERLNTQPPAGFFWCLSISGGKQLSPLKRP